MVSSSLQSRGGNKNKAAVLRSKDIVTEEGEHRLSVPASVP